MLDITTLKKNSTSPPENVTCFGTKEDYNALSKEFKDQIWFLDSNSSKFIIDFLDSTKMISSSIAFDENWPFPKGYFKHVEHTYDSTNRQEIKKWLFNRGIPFQKEVFIVSYFNDEVVLTTWKMVIKNDLFYPDDIIIFDSSIDWCLYYYHDGNLYFGSENIYNIEQDYKKMEELNIIKKKYPNINFPF